MMAIITIAVGVFFGMMLFRAMTAPRHISTPNERKAKLLGIIFLVILMWAMYSGLIDSPLPR